MAIVQISKIVHRTGDLLDLPQLDVGEVGFTTDTKQLFIGNDPLNSEDDIYGKKHTEILTSATPLYFSQFTGSQDTTLNIGNGVQDGQLLVASNNGNVVSWTNKGGNVGGLIDLGHTSNVKLHGGLPGYVLQTDGTGNLTWTTNGVLRYDIASISDTTPAVVTIKVNDPLDVDNYDELLPIIVSHTLTTGSAVTISGVQGATLSGTDGTNRFYIRYIDETSFSLWTSPNTVDEPVTIVGTPVNNTGFALGYIVDPTGATPLGSNTTVQFNDGGTFNGSNKFKFDKITGEVNITGNVIAGNVEATSFVGEAGNLSNIKGANVTGEVHFAATANSIAGGNVSGAVAFATTANAVAGANVSGEVGHAAVANSVAGANVSGAVAFATTANAVAGANVSGEVGHAAVANSVAGANVSGEVDYAAWANGVAGTDVTGTVANATFATSAGSATTAGTVTTNAQPNITSVGNLSYVQLNNTVTPFTANVGEMFWDTGEHTVTIGMEGGVQQQVGLENYMYVKANAAITNGQVVMFAGANGSNILAAPADTTTVGFVSEYIIGVATQDIAHNSFGYITITGMVHGLDTNSWNNGDILWVDNNTPGGLTNVQPSDPHYQIQIAAVTKKAGGDGHIHVRVTPFYRLDRARNVSLTNPTNGQALVYDSANLLWVNGSPASAGTVTTNAQPNITSTGTLANLTVGNTAVASQADIIQLTSSTNKMFVSTDVNGVSILSRSAGKGSGVYLLENGLNRVSLMAPNASTGAATEVARFGITSSSVLNNLTVTGSVVAPIFGGIMQLTAYATTTARDTAIPTPAAGMMIFLTATGKFQGYTGTVWADLN